MIAAPKPKNESERIAALYEYDILDTISEKEYDDITQIAADICGMPISLISIIDSERQWFKSRVGLEAPETHRDLAFCAHAILNPEDIFMVKEPLKDERFHDNPLVTGGPQIAFYAGVPLVTSGGSALGTLCVIDSKPNDLTKEQKETLKALARQVVAQFETRKINKQLMFQKAQLEQLNDDLTRFAHVVAHDIKSPCSSLAMSAEYLKDKYGGVLDKDGMLFLDIMAETSHSAIEMVNGILSHTTTVNKTDIVKEHFKFSELIDELKKLCNIPADFSLDIFEPELEIYSSKHVLLQIFLNLYNNAIKYNDKEQGKIAVSATDLGTTYLFSVNDNGPGISEEDQAHIFDLFATLGVPDRYNNKGTGIGLSTVKRLVQKMGGAIEIKSTKGIGSSFVFTIGK
jgi:signal transduction histidine kinase